MFHSFRHTVGNTLKQKGFPREQVAGLLGHKSGEGFTYTVYADKYGVEFLNELIKSLGFGIDVPKFDKMTFTSKHIRKMKKVK